MKKYFVAVLSLFLFSARGFTQKTMHDPNAEVRKLNTYHAVQVSGGIDLYLSQGSQETVAVSASKTEYRNKIMTKVENGVLKIWFDYANKNLRLDLGDKKLKAYVSVRNLDELVATGGSDVYLDGTLSFPKLKIDMSGGSDFNGKVSCNELNTFLSGGSDMVIAGKATNLFINASGGSDFKGFDLHADYSTVEASGGSDISLSVSKELKAQASGSSDIRYKGNAVVREIKSGGSDITKVN